MTPCNLQQQDDDVHIARFGFLLLPVSVVQIHRSGGGRDRWFRFVLVCSFRCFVLFQFVLVVVSFCYGLLYTLSYFLCFVLVVPLFCSVFFLSFSCFVLVFVSFCCSVLVFVSFCYGLLFTLFYSVLFGSLRWLSCVLFFPLCCFVLFCSFRRLVLVLLFTFNYSVQFCFCLFLVLLFPSSAFVLHVVHCFLFPKIYLLIMRCLFLISPEQSLVTWTVCLFPLFPEQGPVTWSRGNVCSKQAISHNSNKVWSNYSTAQTSN